MRRRLATGTVLAFGLASAPGALVAEAKPGPVTFDHPKHLEAVKQDCKACVLWPKGCRSRARATVKMPH